MLNDEIISLGKDINIYSNDDFLLNFNNKIIHTVVHLYEAVLWLEELEKHITDEDDKKALNRFIKVVKNTIKDWGVDYEHFRS